MTEAKHTPGPWVEQDGYIVAGAWPLGVTVCEPTIAHEGNRLTPEAAKANASLIAAAPDLLAALEILLERAANGEVASISERDLARAALTKAGAA